MFHQQHDQASLDRYNGISNFCTTLNTSLKNIKKGDELLTLKHPLKRVNKVKCGATIEAALNKLPSGASIGAVCCQSLNLTIKEEKNCTYTSSFKPSSPI